MAFTYERIDKDNVALLVVDHQEGLFQMCRDRTPQEMKSSVLAHAELAKVFNLPTILTTSAETGKIQIPVKWTNEEGLLVCLAMDLQDRTVPCPRRSSRCIPTHRTSSAREKWMLGTTLTSGRRSRQLGRSRSSSVVSRPT